MKTCRGNFGKAGLLLLLWIACGASAPSARIHTVEPQAGLDATTRAFLVAVRRGMSREIGQYFPQTGEMKYVHTIHQPGGDKVGIWRFTAEDATRQLRSPSPIFEAIQLSPEGQAPGLFINQVICRGIRWHRTGARRFIPPGADASSAVFVEWRREGGRWVIASFGDETFADDALPEWLADCW